MVAAATRPNVQSMSLTHESHAIGLCLCRHHISLNLARLVAEYNRIDVLTEGGCGGGVAELWL